MRLQKGKRGTILFKIDLEKAYDRVDWGFLHATLLEFGFPLPLVNLIMACVTSSTLSLIWNGNTLPAFAPTSGLRQEDPYLLIFLFSA